MSLFKLYSKFFLVIQELVGIPWEPFKHLGFNTDFAFINLADINGKIISGLAGVYIINIDYNLDHLLLVGGVFDFELDGNFRRASRTQRFVRMDFN